jgi:hypothetical protein
VRIRVFVAPRHRYADSFAAATAIGFNAIPLTGDPEIEPLEGEQNLKTEWLPGGSPDGVGDRRGGSRAGKPAEGRPRSPFIESLYHLRAISLEGSGA